MTDDTVLTQAKGPAKRGSSRAKAIIEWFWLGDVLAERRRALPEPGGRALLLARRAQQSADLARELATSAESTDAPPQANASELYRQSAYWAACAIAARDGGALHADYVESIWDGIGEPFLRKAVERPERVEALRAALRLGSFVYFAELPDDEHFSTFDELRKLSESLINEFYVRAHALQDVQLRRAWRLGLPVLAIVALAFGLSALGDTRDLARGKEWRASSRWGNVGCESPAQQCAESPGFFFHTNEEKDPWIEFDLGSLHPVSVVKVDNRQDCCVERAFPMSVELSVDHKHWKEVARREQEFSHWTASFDSSKARWVRLRVHKVTHLHLDRVKILP